MPIRLTAVGGPLDGQVFEYAKGKAAITLGRLEDRDIRFPVEFRAISRAHLTIVSEGDKYFLRPEAAVFVDGHQAMRDDELPRRCELRLGAPTGPAFKVEWNVLSDIPSTQPPKGWERQVSMREAMRATAGARRLAFAAVGLVVFAAAAVLAYVLLQPEPIRDRLAAARRSVYLVVLRSEAGREFSSATAWVIAPGVLATNAHVVDIIEKQAQAKMKAFVRANFPPYETFEIIEAIKHPHHDRYAKLVGSFAPVLPGGRLVSSMTAYDVGLLRVPAGAELAPPLRLAPPETLHKLAAGDEVGYIGFPLENMLGGGVNVGAPTPQMLIGTITAVTDYLLSEGPPADRHLIQHSLASAGGSSGSPIFNRRGEVIAVHNAGNYVRIQDVRLHSIQISFAQRVDLATEMLDVKVETILLARDAVWQRRLAGLPSAPEYLVQQFQRETNTAGAKPVLESTLVLEKGRVPNKGSALVDFEPPGPGKLMFLAVGEYPNALHLTIRDPVLNNKVLATKAANIHYPWVYLDAVSRPGCWYRPFCAGKVTIGALGDTVGRKIALRVYFAPNQP